MKKQIRKDSFSDLPVGKLKLITDFLPPPSKLLPREETLKITLKLDETTVKFFKGEANRHKIKYQRMMREVLKGYALKYHEDK
jgi:predicted DNA binding CopG/RHH family protein